VRDLIQSGHNIRCKDYSTEFFGNEPAAPTWELRDSFGYTFDGKAFEEYNESMRNIARPKK
jgi:hypothetical protein